MISKILIANRGEIACRIIKTANDLGIDTVAVYSEADAEAKHVALATESVCIGPAPSKDSYLKVDTIIEVAKELQVDAIHPGYGFLSENPGFAKACSDNNIKFIGPSVSAIEAMGSKSAAKSIMEKADVPMIRGYHGSDQSFDKLKAEAERVGYPIMLKAAAGGGGKGMRIVDSADQFQEAFDGTKREAKTSFGDDTLLIEKYLASPRHVEVQVFADQQGNTVYLFERDCSIQRRHQKIVEEAPAPGLSEKLRQAMGEAAVNAAKAINYEGAGTVEFLLEGEEFYFMEMNTRLQVEHPVTEMITGLDLVAWQIAVANGDSLPQTQKELSFHGHAIEVRIYAESPLEDFLPATGSIKYLCEPNESHNVRLDSGINEGDEVSIYYDPMLAKLIVWDESRDAAIDQMLGALKQFQMIGVNNNVGFLQSVVAHEDFRNAELSTHFIPKNEDTLLHITRRTDAEIVASAAILHHAGLEEESTDREDKKSPWSLNSGWRVGAEEEFHYLLSFEHQLYHCYVTEGDCTEITIKRDNEILWQGLGGLEYQNDETLISLFDSVSALEDGSGTELNWDVVQLDQFFHLSNGMESYCVEAGVQSLDSVLDEDDHAATAPMTGTIVSILVQPGDEVEKDAPLVIMEAMKMEHTIRAAEDGRIKEVFFAQGDIVDEGSELIAFEEE